MEANSKKDPLLLWEPTSSRVATCALTAFSRFVALRIGHNPSDLYQWSIDYPEKFWKLCADFVGIHWHNPPQKIFSPPSKAMMRGGQWFPGATLNFCENLLNPLPTPSRGQARGHAKRKPAPIIISYAEGLDRQFIRREFTQAQLSALVAERATLLRSHGVVKGDRVAGVLVNGIDAVVAMLATASLGAVWSSCSPDFGVEAIFDRLEQIRPKILFATSRYVYAGKTFDLTASIAVIASRMPGLKTVIACDHLNPYVKPPTEAQLPPQALLRYTSVEFQDPLYILFSSGTTGVPKCIVHSVGGTLLQHKKELLLHSDVGPDAKLLFFTTCGWMMWNWMVSALSTGATLVLYEGSPVFPEPGVLWDIIDREGVTHFGTSPKYLSACMADALVNGFGPQKKGLGFSALKTILTTGAPLLPEHCRWVYAHIKSDLHLASISGGTDIISCFMLGDPRKAMYAGEIQGPGLGMAIDAWDENGQSLKHEAGQRGELVCTAPFPSMPCGFWNDPDGEKYRRAYFDHFFLGSPKPLREVWRHGDFIEWTSHGGIVVYGRSDATLNPGGVRIGTAELYRQVEMLPQVLDSIAIGQRWAPPGQVGDDTRIVLFVKLRPGITLDAALVAAIKTHIRVNLSPRHVPALVKAVSDIPYTRSGKKMELAVTQLIHGETVANVSAVANPECLSEYQVAMELKEAK